MSYCALKDISKLIPDEELTHITADSGDVVDAAIVTEAIEKADAEIDAYLSMRYAVPLTTVPSIVKALSVDIALYHLYSRRSVAPEVRRTKYEDAIKLLRDIANNKATIGATDSPPDATSSQPVSIENSTRIFTRSEMSGW